MYNIWLLQPLVFFLWKLRFQSFQVSLRFCFTIHVDGRGSSHFEFASLFHGDVVGIGPRFPPKIRSIQFYLSITKTDFPKLCDSYWNCLAVSRFSDSPRDLEAKLWDHELTAQTERVRCLPSSIGVLISLKETNLNVTHDKLYLTRKSRRPFYIMQIAKQELSDTCMDENRCPILKTLIYFMQKNSTMYASKSHEHPKFHLTESSSPKWHLAIY